MKFKVGDKVKLNEFGIATASDFLYDIIHDSLGFDSLSSHIKEAFPGEIVDILPEEGPEGENAYIVKLHIDIPIEFDNLTFADEMERL